jgi:hypothetical protein
MTRRHPRPVNTPMMPATRRGIATGMHVAVMQLTTSPSAAAHTEFTKRLAIVSAAWDAQSSVPIAKRDDELSRALVAALAAAQTIEDRHSSIGEWELSGDDMQAIKIVAARFDECLSKIPYQVYQAAALFVERALKHD